MEKTERIPWGEEDLIDLGSHSQEPRVISTYQSVNLETNDSKASCHDKLPCHVPTEVDMRTNESNEDALSTMDQQLDLDNRGFQGPTSSDHVQNDIEAEFGKSAGFPDQSLATKCLLFILSFLISLLETCHSALCSIGKESSDRCSNIFHEKNKNLKPPHKWYLDWTRKAVEELQNYYWTFPVTRPDSPENSVEPLIGAPLISMANRVHTSMVSPVGPDSVSAPTPPEVPQVFLDRMKLETLRITTYKKWPLRYTVDVREMTKAGFFYLGTESQVRCAFCSVTVQQIRPIDNPMEVHRSLNPHCPMVTAIREESDRSKPSSLDTCPDCPEHYSTLLLGLESTNDRNSTSHQSAWDIHVDLSGFIDIRVHVVHPTDDLPSDDPVSDDLPSDDPPSDDPPSDDFPSDDPPSDDPPSDDLPSDTPPTDDLPSDTPPTDDLPSDDPPSDDLPSDTPPTDDLPSDTPPTDDLPSDTPPTDDLPSDTPPTDDLSDTPPTDDLPSDTPPTDGAPTDAPPTVDPPSSTQADVETLRQENQELVEQFLCKICLVNQMCVIFLPCGHLTSCSQCAAVLQKCPICRSQIKGKSEVTNWVS